MAQGSRVGGPAPCFFLFVPFLFSTLSFISYVCLGWGIGFHPLCLDPFPFLRCSHFSFLLLSLLGVDVRQPRGVGIWIIV